MHNLEFFKLHEADGLERLKLSQLIISGSHVENDPEVSEDSDLEERETKYNLLDADQMAGGGDMIEEEDEGNECDDCSHQLQGGDESSEELPLIRDVNRQKFGRINPHDSEEDSGGSWDLATDGIKEMSIKQTFNGLGLGKYPSS